MSAVEKLSFGSTVLNGSGKTGVLKPIDGDYYLLNSGGFNIPNRTGVTYRINDYLIECMNGDSDFARRVSEGQMFCEWGHPPTYFYEIINGREVRTQITDIFQWVQRLRTVVEREICAFIRKVHFTYDKRGDIRVVPVHTSVEIRPYGARKDVFQDSITDPNMNTAVSIRSVTAPQKPGDKFREIEYWTNFDVVPEQGMLNACKYRTAGLESFQNGLDNFSQENMEMSCTVGDIIYLSKRVLADDKLLERVEGSESLKNAIGLIKHLESKYSSKEKITMRKTNSLSLFL